jgi:group I intron endonuclease
MKIKDLLENDDMLSLDSGIYAIIYHKKSKIYIGSAVHFKRRFIAHISLLKRNKHDNTYLQNIFNKYGLSEFTFVILEKCSRDYLITKEQDWINKFDFQKDLINICPTAGSRLGSINWTQAVRSC